MACPQGSRRGWTAVSAGLRKQCNTARGRGRPMVRRVRSGGTWAGRDNDGTQESVKAPEETRTPGWRLEEPPIRLHAPRLTDAYRVKEGARWSTKQRRFG